MLESLRKAFVDALFPPRCVGCGTGGTLICRKCEDSLPGHLPPFCSLCARPLARGEMGRRGKGEGGTLCNRCAASPLAIDGIRSVFVYDGVAREAIIRLKYHGLQSLAGPLGRRMGAYLLANPLPVDTIAPVPLHITRSKMRGYNQADLLTGCVAAATGLRKLDRALIRVRDTPAQVKTASAEERRRNVRGAFKAVEGEVKGRRILVLDDVCTTGSTLEACSTALREAGAGAVWGLTLARET